jgi:alanine racemase
MFESAVTWAEIDLDAIEQNIQELKKFVGDSVEIYAVLKANAYGHGAVPVAQAALQAGATRLAVHRLVEGIQLRTEGIQAPILILGYTPPAGARMVVENHLTPSVITREFACALSQQAEEMGRRIPFHIKVDTGMNRYGLLPEEVSDFITEVNHLPGIFLEGLYTHFGTADWTDTCYTQQQLSLFHQVIETLRRAGTQIPQLHAANSAAVMRFPEAHFNAVRPGLSIYGVPPSNEWQPPFPLRPALTLKSCISRIREIPPGSAVSYNRTYIAKRSVRAALVPVGYGDGYPRSLSNSGCVLIHGQRARVIGRVCMDQFVVDVSSIPEARQDDEVVIIGKQGEDAIPAQELASQANTIPNEIFTRLSSRVVRFYYRNGSITTVRTG